MKHLSGIIPGEIRREFNLHDLRAKRQRLRAELEDRYAEELARVSWWQRFQLRRRIRAEIDKEFPAPSWQNVVDRTV